MKLSEFNQDEAGSLRPMLLACVAIPHWADGIIAARPFISLEQLLAFADDLARLWPSEQLDQAL